MYEYLISIPGNLSSTFVGAASNPKLGFTQCFTAEPQSSVSVHVPSPKSMTSINFLSADATFALIKEFN